MDNNSKDQVEQGVIEKIHIIDQYSSDYLKCPFLPHMGVFKISRGTTDCRVVYLSNLCQKDKDRVMTVSYKHIFCEEGLWNRLRLNYSEKGC